VIRRFYVHNFRCLENFGLPVAGQPSVLLIGNNGSGKTTVKDALEILQKIARRANRVDELVTPEDFFLGRTDAPMRFEIEVELDGQAYEYAIAFELAEAFRELRVREEKLSVDGAPIYTRKEAEVQLARTGHDPVNRHEKISGFTFRIDWRLVALPIVQERSQKDPLFIFKQWMARMLILRPIPSLIAGDSTGETLQPKSDLTDFAAWFSALLAHAPSAYGTIDQYLKQVMPDLRDLKNPVVGKDSRSIEVQFSNGRGSVSLPFGKLSDGEKCFMICALVLAANAAYGPLLCFWDEPDAHLALHEVGHFVLTLRKTFQSGGQFIMTSHNPEAIRRFSDENTLVLHRRSHLEPTIIRPLSEIQVDGNLVSALIRGDVVGP
jgi:predicted ATPase